MNDTQELQLYFCPYGYLDIKAACDIGDSVWLYERDLFEIIEDYREVCGYPDHSQIDPVATVLEHILQMARNEISEVTWYDFLNDFSGSGTEIYTHGNYMCSSYDSSEEATEEFKEQVIPHLEKLKSNKWCQYLFSELELGL